MAKYEKKVKGTYQSVLSAVDEAIKNIGAHGLELIDESECKYDDVIVLTRVYERYYIRSGNYASLTLTMVEHNDEISIIAIGAGGGTNFLNLNLGAEDDIIKKFQKNLERYDTFNHD
ncbi:DUF6054 family protein [Anaeromicropila herbilytica]|uniref:Uncharacterized protein n=1 Tax=Anaeromicropila herbilytica TaxID=2785025 RepID=A0A7R7EKU8_9FIRM|nr:DUF6054 family protein [Anaeromicropila herbilytica]BCN30613.1 hypothetical protein bsdtb5_19080 [Anaeromicropila herbilytica]